ncbi:MAG TPA: hypothetical protein VFR85_11070 [Anaeromyxobacteraceae bacterium]|nr:hypothetical protein [Anaeromyxobacteraceae bacterium]
MRPPLALLLAASALSACAGPSGAGRGSGAETVSLRFAWPEGMRLRVFMRHEARRGDQPRRGALMQHLVVVEGRGDELWISNRDFQAQGNEEDLEQNMRISEALVQVVARDGAFRRAEGLDEGVAVVQPDSEADRARLRDTLARATAEDWEATVGAWRGQSLAAGGMRRKQVAASLPLVPAVPVRMSVEYGLEALVPCAEEETERRCAALVYRGEPAASDQATAAARLRELLSHGEGAVELEDFSARFEITMVTDPATLIPKRMTSRQELRMRVRLGDGRVREVVERSEDEFRFEAEVVI